MKNETNFSIEQLDLLTDHELLQIKAGDSPAVPEPPATITIPEKN